MISIFIREQQRYTQKQIFKLLKRKETESANIIAKLKGVFAKSSWDRGEGR